MTSLSVCCICAACMVHVRRSAYWSVFIPHSTDAGLMPCEFITNDLWNSTCSIVFCMFILSCKLGSTVHLGTILCISLYTFKSIGQYGYLKILPWDPRSRLWVVQSSGSYSGSNILSIHILLFHVNFHIWRWCAGYALLRWRKECGRLWVLLESAAEPHTQCMWIDTYSFLAVTRSIIITCTYPFTVDDNLLQKSIILSSVIYHYAGHHQTWHQPKFDQICPKIWWWNHMELSCF